MLSILLRTLCVFVREAYLVPLNCLCLPIRLALCETHTNFSACKGWVFLYQKI